MSPRNLSPMIAALLILGGSISCALGGLHAVFTLLDLRNPRRLVPVDPAVAQAMANSPLRLSRGGTDMWRTWIGFNFTHSLGILLFGSLGIWASTQVKTLPAGVLPALTLIGCLYLVICLLYFFRTPAIGVGIVTVCFAAAWVLSLINTPMKIVPH